MSTTGISGVGGSSNILQLWETLLKRQETTTTGTTDTSSTDISDLITSLTDNSDLLSQLLDINSGMAQMGRKVKETSNNVFTKLDTNDDGSISEDEMIAVFGSTDGATKFSEADTDGDGTVTAAELKTAMESAREKEMSENMFAKLDTDESDGISEDEMIAAFGETEGAEKFSEADTDGDGTVTIDELQAAMEKTAEEMGPPPPPPMGMGGMAASSESDSTSSSETIFSSIDANGDGTISQEELTAFLQSGGTTSQVSDTYSQISQILAAFLKNSVDTTT
jgi:Ca2+-binding EF-hand superfamily protein